MSTDAAAQDPVDRVPAQADAVVALLRGALTEQRAELTRSVDDDVLQYACGALQDLQEIHRASPTESLWRAIGNLHNAITSLRTLVERQADVDADLERRALPVVHDALRQAA